jgi:N-acyl-D-aspartate/D-glutamate deacylase
MIAEARRFGESIRRRTATSKQRLRTVTIFGTPPSEVDMTTYDVIIENGRWFDGLGSASEVRHLGIRNGKVQLVSASPIAERGRAKVIDARGQWVMPGFIDVHTHYDAEVLVAPGLTESVRHGVTTVFIGSCSLSTVHVSPLDGADLFSRVEAVPREHVLAALERHKTWTSAAGYAEFLESSPLGPNVTSFIGHSDIRAHVMGLGRAVDGGVQPTEGELARMERLVEDALDAGYVGLSTMTNPWDKLDGDRYRSKSLPSTFASWSEYRRLNRILRRRGRVLQSAPNLTAPVNALLFFLESMAGVGRRPLKTSLLTAADSRAARFLARLVTGATRVVNRFAGGDVRWQHVPVPFEIYADGIDLVVFEEFGAGRAALHLKHELERNALLRDPGYRERFRRDVEAKLTPRVWHRNFHLAEIIACPDASAVGKSFGQVADERGVHPVDAFLDMVVEHGTRVRWRTTLANDRPGVLDELSAHPDVQMGFADSGAHLRNMAFYNFPLRLLKRVHASRGSFMSLERAVHRLTGELARWYDIDAGTLCEGDRADVVIVNPAALDDSVDAYHEAVMPEFGNLRRMVNRSDGVVTATLVGGEVVFENGAFSPGYGKTARTGRFLRAGEPRGTVCKRPRSDRATFRSSSSQSASERLA